MVVAALVAEVGEQRVAARAVEGLGGPEHESSRRQQCDLEVPGRGGHATVARASASPR